MLIADTQFGLFIAIGVLVLLAATTYVVARYLHPIWIPGLHVLVFVTACILAIASEQHKSNLADDDASPIGLIICTIGLNTLLLPLAAAGVILQNRSLPPETMTVVNDTSLEALLKRYPRRHPWVG